MHVTLQISQLSQQSYRLGGFEASFRSIQPLFVQSEHQSDHQSDHPLGLVGLAGRQPDDQVDGAYKIVCLGEVSTGTARNVWILIHHPDTTNGTAIYGEYHGVVPGG